MIHRLRPALAVFAATLCIAIGTASIGCSSAAEESVTPDRGGGAENDDDANGGRGGARADAGDASRSEDDAASLDDTAAPNPDAAIEADTPSGADTPTPPPPRPDSGRVEDECAQVSAVGDPAYAPVDIIWVIDTSGSMNEEAALVAENLNAFVEFIEASGLDVRVVLVAGDTVCVPAPLSGGSCPDTDSDRYRHVRRVVGSHDAFQALVDTYPAYSDFLRPEAIKHFIVVSDDESTRSARWFVDEMAAQGLPYFVFHAIVSLEETEDCTFGICIPQGCSGVYGDAEAMGDLYIVASEMTGGTASSICEPDWSPAFDGIADNVIAAATLPCDYRIPDLGGGLEIVYSRVDVTINGVFLTHHDTAEGCRTAPGWYYDVNDAPEIIHICPSVCGSGFDGDEIAIEFGCVKS